MFRIVTLLLAVGVLALLGLRVLALFGIGQPAPPHYDKAGLPLGPVTYQQVVAHAEARRHYPGSTVFSRFGGGEYRQPMSDDVDAAFAGAVLTSDAKPAEIYLWYQLWLLKHGWRSVARGAATTWLSHES